MRTITTNGTVQRDGQTMRVVGHDGFDNVVLKAKGGSLATVPVEELLDEATAARKVAPAADPIRLAKVTRYKSVLEPLTAARRRTRADVEAAAAALETSVPSVYRALGRFQLTNDFNELPPPTRPGGRGGTRLVAGAEAIIAKAIEEILLTRRQHRVAKFMADVKKMLSKAGFKVSDATLHARVDAVPSSVWVGKRQGHKTAKRLLDPHRGEAPTGDGPLDIVQVDHWKTDVEILDDDRLTVIGRAWLTLGIDLYTRVVWGWHLGLDHPGTVPTAFCMINGVTRKDKAIKALGLSARMPFWGMPKVLHLDNAGEFRGKTMAAACGHFHVTLKFRPVESPEYGAHIERLNGTLAAKFKDLPGATGASTAERKALRPEATAALTFGDLAKQLVLIFDEYHNTPHAGIGGATPLQKWTDHFFHADGRPKRTLPAIVADDLEFRLHWYPLRHCTLQAYGLRIQFLDYYDEEIEQLVRDRKDHGKIEVRRNPLDVREVYALHPVRREWIVVPCRYFAFPVATIKDLRESRREAKRLGRQPTPENLAAIIDERQIHLEEAQKKTKSAARQAVVAANNRKMRAAAPKGLGKAAGKDDGTTTGGSGPPHAATGKPSDVPRPATGVVPPKPRPAAGKPAFEPADEFAGSAAAMAAISDDDIDRYLDGR